MNPKVYDDWYRTDRGSWIGDTEYRLLQGILCPAPGASMIDAGCGTGYFTRRFAQSGVRVTGIDPAPAMIRFAQSRQSAGELYAVADACALPFPDRIFDLGIAVTSFCFIRDQKTAVSELVRVTRGRIALGLLNRRSVLYWEKGRRGGSGAYRGAYWHTAAEARALFAGLPVSGLTVRTAIFLPHAAGWGRRIERWLQPRSTLGGFLVVTGEIVA
ncbi:MAG: class I SAM-dependent methyltransferase [Burkholderiales bacterium]